MNSKDLIRLGVPLGEPMRRATDFISRFVLSGGDKARIEDEVKAILENPALFAEDPLRKDFAKALDRRRPLEASCSRSGLAYPSWGCCRPKTEMPRARGEWSRGSIAAK